LASELGAHLPLFTTHVWYPYRPPARLAFVALAGTIWWNWEDIVKKPGVLSIINRTAGTRATPLRVLESSEQLPGYRLVKKPILPADLPMRPVFASGAFIRVALQAADSTSIVEIQRADIDLRKLEAPNLYGADYVFDPTAQPGFGAAQPRTYTVNAADERTGVAFYIDPDGRRFVSSFPNILPLKLPLLRLDPSSGLQETMDINLTITHRGFYVVKP
jgi:hypothetical protein